MNDVIAAIATAQGLGGVAIVRLSGAGSLDIAKKMFSRKGDFTPNMLYAGTIDCGDFSDYGMCVYFRAPKSFTGEDGVEFHCHGGRAIAHGVLRQTLACGARLAERGEFTKRAFLNGKLSLSAAEGMADMIHAQSQAQVRAGYMLYGEKLTNEGKRLQNELTVCLAGIDADLDYPEEDLTLDTRAEIGKTLARVKERLFELLKSYRAGEKIKSGVTVAICGKPNAGKSSLLNALLGYDKAIVSSVAGTTRDAVEGSIELNGVLFRLIDTAGLRESDDEIEREGIRRAEKAAASADVIVHVKEEEEPPFAFLTDVPVITVASKGDIKRRADCDVCVSSVTGDGLPALRDLLYEKGFGRENDGAYLMEERHYRALSSAKEWVCAALDSVNGEAPAELYAVEIKRAWDCLGEISGETATEAIINEIFSKFCVGK
ncbi:MAG: tRNA uridine-5-carboxymethylaminomethyl(34) synthesis GTPase MnmE [Clostridia bacterium]|jgi:tRNA modification GTPase|nr:tRNA uridine-5-carboxymethylaminomethyl(34) synthesis GTPase MnmE [Clostridia bacterium]